MSNFKTILLLLVLVLVTAGLDLYLGVGRTRPRPAGLAVLKEDVSDVRKVAIRRPGVATVVLERQDGAWRLVEPFAGSADRIAVSKFFDAVSQTPVSESISDSELLQKGRTRADFALEEPFLSVELTEGSGKVALLSFGAKTPAGNGVYAAVGGVDAVFVVKRSALAAVDVAADDLRRRSLFLTDLAAVSSFVVKRESGQPLEFSRADAGWKVGAERASSAKVTEYLNALLSSTAERFVWPVGASNETEHAASSLLAGYGLESDSAVNLTVKGEDGVSRRISFGKAAGDGLVYALVQNGGAIVTVSERLRDFLVQDPVMFTDSRIFPVETAAVTGFSISDGGAIYSLSRDDGGRWRLESPIVAATDSDAVSSILARILALSPADVVPQGGLLVSIGTNATKVLVARERVLGKLTFESMRAREMLKVDPALVKRIVSTRAEAKAAPQSVVYDRDRREWNAENADGALQPNVARIAAVLAALNPLTAARVEKLSVTAAELNAYGLDAPALTLAVDQASDVSVRRNILFGKKTRGGRFATIGSSDAVFVVPESVVGKLFVPILGK